jgi:4-oxalocrotonate tautomerase
MPLINFKAIEGVISPEQKRELIQRLTDATASVYGEGIRQVTWVVIEDVNSGDWGIAGKPATTADILDLTRFRGHCSPWGEEGVHDAEDSTAVSAAAAGAAH